MYVAVKHDVIFAVGVALSMSCVLMVIKLSTGSLMDGFPSQVLHKALKMNSGTSFAIQAVNDRSMVQGCIYICVAWVVAQQWQAFFVVFYYQLDSFVLILPSSFLLISCCFIFDRLVSDCLASSHQT